MKTVQLINILLAVFVGVVAFAIWRDLKISLSVVIGSVIGGANLWGITYIVKKMFSEGSSKWKAAVLAFLKLGILIFVIWALINYSLVAPVGFLVGLSVTVFAMLVGWKHGRF